MRVGKINIDQGEIVTTEGQAIPFDESGMIVSDQLVSRMSFITVFHVENLNA